MKDMNKITRRNGGWGTRVEIMSETKMDVGALWFIPRGYPL